MRSYWIKVGPQSNERVLIGTEEDTQRHREEGHMKTEAEIGGMLPQAKKHQEPPGARRGKEGFSPRAFEGSMTQLTPWF